MNYIEIDYNKVKGFKKLTPEQQYLFIKTYKVHNSIQGLDYKEDWTPKSVQWVADIRCSYLKVVFRNGEWLHYLPNGTWY